MLPNPLRWNCKVSGCYNEILRPKIEVFSDCFPGKINFGDVDGIVEINAHGLLLEWKSKPVLHLGQSIMYKRLSANCVLSVLCIAGNAATMEARDIASFFNGEFQPWIAANLTDAKQMICDWVKWAQHRPWPERSTQEWARMWSRPFDFSKEPK